MKNKYLLTVSISSILLLTSCGDTWRDLTGSRTEQSVSGGRRTPTLNKSISNPSKEVPVSEKTELSSPVKPAQVSESNPYDKYDADGNEVKSSEGKGNFFSNLVGWNETKKPAETTLVEENLAVTETPKPTQQHVMRKPLQGNLPYQPQKPATMTPEVQVDTAVKEDKKEDFFSKTSVPQEAPKEAVKEKEIVKEVVQDKPVDNKSSETLLGQIGSKPKFANDEKPISDKKDTFPSVSSVPEKPEEFKAVSEEKKQNFDALKTEHEAAQQEKQALDNEVTGVTTPVAKPEATPEPTPAPVVAETKPAEKIDAISSEEKAKRDADVIVPEYSSEPVVLPPTTASESNVKSDVKSAETAPAPTPVEVQSTEAKPEEKKEEKQAEPIDVPSSDSSLSSLPSQDVTTPVDSGFEPASKLIGSGDGTESNLPSPEIIKTLRPSRYETRRRASSSY